MFIQFKYTLIINQQLHTNLESQEMCIQQGNRYLLQGMDCHQQTIEVQIPDFVVKVVTAVATDLRSQVVVLGRERILPSTVL